MNYDFGYGFFLGAFAVAGLNLAMAVFASAIASSRRAR